MTELKIYPVWHETETIDGYPARVVAYIPSDGCRPWRGYFWNAPEADWYGSRWAANTANLKALPAIPAEAREPVPWEVWRIAYDDKPPVLILEVDGATALVWTKGSKRLAYLRPGLSRPWHDSDGLHGFEPLIQAHRKPQ